MTSGVLLCLIVVVARLLFTRRKSNDANSEQGKTGGQFKTSNTGETTITNGFSADDISEIDADIDLTTPLPMSTNPNITRNDVRRCYLCNHGFVDVWFWNRYEYYSLSHTDESFTNAEKLMLTFFRNNRITAPTRRHRALMATWALPTYHIHRRRFWCRNHLQSAAAQAWDRRQWWGGQSTHPWSCHHPSQRQATVSLFHRYLLFTLSK